MASITFTGSPKVGIGIKAKAGLKRVTLELGSNAAVIIDEDVELTDELIERVKWGAFVNNGQVCISVQRVLYMKRRDDFLSKLRKAMETVVVGDPLIEETDVSALISKKMSSVSITGCKKRLKKEQTFYMAVTNVMKGF